MTARFATQLNRTVEAAEARAVDGGSGGAGNAGGADGVTVYRMPIGADEQVFRGHYPDHPIFPGVCLIECTHHAAVARPPAAGRPVLTGVESVRFLSPVYPGDELTVELGWKQSAGVWKARATLSTDRGKSARIRLAYAFEGA